MDGVTALEYARSRHGTNDFARAGRQQKVLVGLRSRALQLNMLSRAPELVGIVRKSLSTDLSPVQMLALAKLISQVDRDRIANLVIDTSYANPFRGPDGADLLQPNIPAIKHAIDSAQRSAAHPELRAKIEVLNGSGTAGLGQKAADYLTAQGFNVVRIAAAERSDYRSSLVQVLTEDKGAAEALATTLRMPTTAISQVPTPHAEADIRIVVGQDFLRRSYSFPGGDPWLVRRLWHLRHNPTPPLRCRAIEALTDTSSQRGPLHGNITIWSAPSRADGGGSGGIASRGCRLRASDSRPATRPRRSRLRRRCAPRAGPPRA